MNMLTSVFKHYWPFVVAYKGTVTIALVFFGSGTLLTNIVTPLLYREIIDTVSAPDVQAQLLLVPLLQLVGLVVLSAVTANVCYRLGEWAHIVSQSKIMKHLSDYVFKEVHNHSYQFFVNTFTGSLVAKHKRFVRSFEVLHDTFTFNMWMNGIVLLGTFGVLLWLSPVLGLFFLMWLSLYVSVTVWFVRRKIPKDLAQAEAESTMTGALADAITNALTMKMFATRSAEYTHFGVVTDTEERKRRHAWIFSNIQFTVQGLFLVVFEGLAMSFVIWMWTRGVVSAGTIVLVQLYVIKLFDITWNLGRNITRVLQAFTDAKEMVDILDMPIDVVDGVDKGVRFEKGAIDFNHVTFAYDRGKPVFSDFSVSIKAGEKVGLVGHSGAGKTTVTKLLLRFANLQKGEILIDGHNIAHITQDDLRRHISYVPQEPLLFHRSLRENIAYGKPDATEEEIIEVAKRARAHEFIEKLPDGYETLVGERGVKLSGGERQRVAIARAMLKDAPILILDEATSSLDSLSERKIQEAFAELMKGKTALVVAHRLSTISQMDRILVFDQGKVVEEGTHAELVMKKGVYAELWNEQAGGFLGE